MRITASPPRLLTLWLALTSLAAAQAAAPLNPAADAHEAPAPYWTQHRDGWFWYQDPSPAPRTRAQPRDAQRQTLAAFHAMQARLETLKQLAVMAPSESNLLAYMHYQRFVMQKSETFAARWQRLVWQSPALDYGLTGRPTNALAVNVFDDAARAREADTVRALAQTHGLLWVFRSDCPFCHRFAPILKRFETDFGMTVLAVSTDGGRLPEYPDALRDNGLVARLAPRVVPALYLTRPADHDIRAVGFGLLSGRELLERIAALAPPQPQTSAGSAP